MKVHNFDIFYQFCYIFDLSSALSWKALMFTYFLLQWEERLHFIGSICLNNVTEWVKVTISLYIPTTAVKLLTKACLYVHRDPSYSEQGMEETAG